MDNTKTPSTVLYVLRHLFTFNITDPLSDASRGTADYKQYFSGTGAAGQTNYLERKLATNGSMVVKVGGATKTINTDYTHSNTTGRITWTGTTPASGSDNITVEYQSVLGWIYDDTPQLDANYFPRMSVLEVNNGNEDPGQGIYASYASGIGQKITKRIKIIVRNRRNSGPDEGYTYGSKHYKNYDLVLAVSEAVEAYMNANRVPIPWKFWDWSVLGSERITSEEEFYNILRRDITAEVKYYRGETA